VNQVALTVGSSGSKSSSDADRSKQHDSDAARHSAVGGDIRPRDVIVSAQTTSGREFAAAIFDVFSRPLTVASVAALPSISDGPAC